MALMIIWTDDEPATIELKNADGERVPNKRIELMVTREDLQGFSADALMKRYFEPAMTRIQRMFNE